MSSEEPMMAVIPSGASTAQEEQLIQAAIDTKIDDDIERMLGDVFK